MNIANIKKISFTKYEIATINTVREYLKAFEDANGIDEIDDRELRISFCQDVVVIDRVDDNGIAGTEFEMLQGKVTINNFEPGDEAMKLYCQAEYLAALEGATTTKLNTRSVYMNAGCDTYPISDGTLEFAINMDLLSEVGEYLCPGLLTI